MNGQAPPAVADDVAPVLNEVALGGLVELVAAVAVFSFYVVILLGLSLPSLPSIFRFRVLEHDSFFLVRQPGRFRT